MSSRTPVEPGRHRHPSASSVRPIGDRDVSITIRFCGAAHTVTGSCYLFQTRAGRFLVDCGLFQGQKTLKELNYGAFPFDPASIRHRASDACPYRSQRAVAKAGEGRLQRPHPGDARHDRSVFLHAARRRKHPGIRGCHPQPAQCRPQACRGQSDLYAGRCDRITAVVPAGRIRDLGGRRCRACGRVTGTPGIFWGRLPSNSSSPAKAASGQAAATARLRRYRSGCEIAPA